MSEVVALDALPEGWARTRLTDVADVNPPKPRPGALAADAPVSFVPMPAVDAASGAITGAQERPFTEVRKGYTGFADGDVLLAKITPCFENGKAAVASGLRNGVGFGSSEFHVLRPRGVVLPEYLHHFVRQPAFREVGAEHMTGTAGQARVPVEYVREVELPVPPLTEQRRIVEAADALLGRVRVARERIAAVRRMVARFRQAVLAAACSGRLTEGWRLEHIAGPTPRPAFSYADGDAASCEGVGSLPPTWACVPLDRVALRVTDGTHQPPPTVADGIPFLLIGNFKQGHIVWDAVSKFVTPATYAELTRRCIPERGDVLYTAVGATFGQAIAVDWDRPFVFQRHIAHIKPDHASVRTAYLTLVLNAPFTYALAKEVARGAAQPTVTLGDLKRFPVPLPSLYEQAEIVRRVDAAFRLADAVDRRATAALAHLDKLPQAILTKAFTGQLVPAEAELARAEGRDYEPADALLARLAAGRSDARPRTRAPARGGRQPATHA